MVETPNDFDVTLTPDTGVATDKITVTGGYFGSTCPKVTVEWQVESKGKVKTKKATCKVIKPYKDDDANGKLGKSVMYVGQEPPVEGFQPGDSELTVVVPKGITESTTATLKLNCNGTIVERPFKPHRVTASQTDNLQPRGGPCCPPLFLSSFQCHSTIPHRAAFLPSQC